MTLLECSITVMEGWLGHAVRSGPGVSETSNEVIFCTHRPNISFRF